MNDLLQQLIGMSPAIGQMLSGNGPEATSFMQGFERARQRDEERKRLKTQDQLALDERTRTRTRQDDADKQAGIDRERRRALEGLQIPGHLAEIGSAADTPQQAQSIIESAIPNLMKVFGQETMAYGMPAIEQATRTITGRQKKQVSDYVEQAVKTAYVADNPDADPELQLPEHLSKMLGKPSAKLSELQQFAQLPVGKPAGKTRVPPAAGSFEEYSDPSTPPERKAQIEADRKKYMQADDRPSVNVTLPGGISTKAGDAALKFQDDYARDSKPYIQLRDAYQRVKAAKPDAAGDLSLIFAYMKILDPNSVVREQEFANAQNAAGVPDRVRNLYNQVMQGTRLNPEQRRQFLGQAEALFGNARKNQQQVRSTYSNRAKQWGIPESMILDDDPMLTEQAAPPADAPAPTSGGPQLKERRKIKGQLAEWDGKGWVAVVK